MVTSCHFAGKARFQLICHSDSGSLHLSQSHDLCAQCQETMLPHFGIRPAPQDGQVPEAPRDAVALPVSVFAQSMINPN
jgi:hypothetical protein